MQTLAGRKEGRMNTPPRSRFGEALLPCPFCGSADVDRHFALTDLEPGKKYDPGCMSCGATAPIEVWNKALRGAVNQQGCSGSNGALQQSGGSAPSPEVLAAIKAGPELLSPLHADARKFGKKRETAEEFAERIVRMVLSAGSEKQAQLPGAIWLAAWFHETYERLAPQYGYETKQETRAFDATTPNGKLMIAVCRELREALTRKGVANGE